MPGQGPNSVAQFREPGPVAQVAVVQHQRLRFFFDPGSFKFAGKDRDGTAQPLQPGAAFAEWFEGRTAGIPGLLAVTSEKGSVGNFDQGLQVIEPAAADDGNRGLRRKHLQGGDRGRFRSGVAGAIADPGQCPVKVEQQRQRSALTKQPRRQTPQPGQSGNAAGSWLQTGTPLDRAGARARGLSGQPADFNPKPRNRVETGFSGPAPA